MVHWNSPTYEHQQPLWKMSFFTSHYCLIEKEQVNMLNHSILVVTTTKPYGDSIPDTPSSIRFPLGTLQSTNQPLDTSVREQHIREKGYMHDRFHAGMPMKGLERKY